jgi:predicted secreted protein
MTLTGAIAIYFVLWWIVLFAVLPWGTTSPHELGHEVEPGHAQSAPVQPHLLVKFAVTTLVSAIIFAGVWWLVASGWVTLDNIPFLPRFRAA